MRYARAIVLALGFVLVMVVLLWSFDFFGLGHDLIFEDRCLRGRVISCEM
jgi:hypothetical protein